MKKAIFFLFVLFAIFNARAQDLTISFQPKVSGTPIDSIRATNLRTNQTVKLLGSETLLLVKPTGINPLRDNTEYGYVFPNPTDKDATLSFSTQRSQEVEISLFNVTGQLLGQQKQSLIQGTHHYQLKFPVAGIYYVSVNKSEGNESFKVVYSGRETQSSSIEYSGSENLKVPSADVNYLKSATTGKTLTYKDGDVIQYSFSSGKNTTILTDIPTSSKALNVEFVECIDKDNRSYKVVKIGSQWWMAENLAYLPAVYPPTSESATEPYYYVYGYIGADVATAKQQTNYANYGVLYNWSAAKIACPSGWHLPSDAEWTVLENYLIANGFNFDGTTTGNKIAKSMAATTNWNASANTGTIGNNLSFNNKSGFWALPAGYRISNGTFGSIDNYGFWRSSTESSALNAWSRRMYYDYSDVNRTNSLKEDGFSVRCLKD